MLNRVSKVPFEGTSWILIRDMPRSCGLSSFELQFQESRAWIANFRRPFEISLWQNRESDSQDGLWMSIGHVEASDGSERDFEASEQQAESFGGFI